MGDESRSQVLVTGGSGFIGRRLVRALLGTGAHVTVADKRAFPDGAVESIVGDLRDPSVVSRVARRGTDAIVHLAAATGTLDSIEDPTETYHAARSVTGAELPAEHTPPKPGEMPAVIVDISAARALGYRPQHDLKSGLATVWPEFSEASQ